jgi:hypothetical protein
MRKRLYILVPSKIGQGLKMRSVQCRLCGVLLALIIALSALYPMAGAGAALSSSDHVPMPPGDFTLYRSDHFDIYYDSTRIMDVSDVGVGAEAAYQTATGFFGTFNYRTKVILASEHQQYVNILTYSIPGTGDIAENNVAGNWGDGERGTIVIESPDQLPDFDIVIAHEFSHIVMRTRLIDNKYTIPEWFSDGLAIYVSGGVSTGDRAAVEESCRNDKLMTVAEIEAILERSDDPATSANEASLALAQSGMLMGFIANKCGNDSIKLIMQDFGPTGDLDEAFIKRLGYGPEGFNADWKMALKGQMSVRDGLVLSQRVSGHVLDANGKPVANETIAFTCMRNDSSVFGKTYTAVTDGAGYYKLDLTYGLFNVHLDRQGYTDVDESITLQKNEVRQYNVTLTEAGVVAPSQNILSGPGVAVNQTIYAVLGLVNAAAIMSLVLVFWRARK